MKSTTNMNSYRDNGGARNVPGEGRPLVPVSERTADDGVFRPKRTPGFVNNSTAESCSSHFLCSQCGQAFRSQRGLTHHTTMKHQGNLGDHARYKNM